MRKIRLRLAYDGTRYCGWQIQTNGPSIQAAVEQAIERLTGRESAVVAAGRTDAGVHALGQVAHFETASTIGCDKIRSGLQTFLGDEIVVLEAQEAPPAFHARYDAIRKRYRYLIDNSAAPLPFLRNYAYHVRRPLDAEAMHAAGQVLVGTHDFRCFESRWPNRPTSVRTVMELSVTRQSNWPIWSVSSTATCPADQLSVNAPFVCLDIVADGFLYNMVRSIMGTLLEVGRGKWNAEDVRRILTSQDRAVAGPTVPPHGLCLIEVDYAADGTRPALPPSEMEE